MKSYLINDYTNNKQHPKIDYPIFTNHTPKIEVLFRQSKRKKMIPNIDNINRV